MSVSECQLVVQTGLLFGVLCTYLRTSPGTGALTTTSDQVVWTDDHEAAVYVTSKKSSSQQRAMKTGRESLTALTVAVPISSGQSPTIYFMPNAHCRRRRDATVELSCVGGVNTGRNQLTTTADGCVHTSRHDTTRLAVGKFVQTRRDCRQLVANSVHTADATQLDSCVASASAMCRGLLGFTLKPPSFYFRQNTVTSCLF